MEIHVPRIPQGLQGYYDSVITNLITGLGVPPVILGTFIQVGRAVGENMRVGFERRVLRMQHIVKEWYEGKIFPMELDLAGFNVEENKVAMRWRPLLVLRQLSGGDVQELVDGTVISREEARGYLRSLGMPISGVGTEELAMLDIPEGEGNGEGFPEGDEDEDDDEIND